MPISEFKDTREEVEFRGGSFSVRAISLPDVSALIEVHEYVVNNIVDKVRARKELFDQARAGENEEAMAEVVSSVITELIRESPILVANLIAICADEPDQMGNVARMPVSVQLDAVSKIAKLTFTDLASVKKLAADVMAIVNGILPT